MMTLEAALAIADRARDRFIRDHPALVTPVLAILGHRPVGPAADVCGWTDYVTRDGIRGEHVVNLVARADPPLNERSYRAVLAHEIGHVWGDLLVTNPGREAEWAAIRNQHFDPEDCADVFAYVLGYLRPPPPWLRPPTPGEIDGLLAAGLLPGEVAPMTAVPLQIATAEPIKRVR